MSKRYQEAEREFEQAIASNPNLFEAHYFYARACFVQGKLESAALHWERAAELKPDDYQAVMLLRQVYHSLGRLKDENEATRRCLERVERELARNPENARAAYLYAGALAKVGEVDRAKEWASRALAIDPDDVLTRYNIACFCCFIGELDRALDLLVGLLAKASFDMKAWVLNDSDFEPLHNHPGWQKVLELTRYVWSGRASQEVFVELAVGGLASMYPASNWSSLGSEPSWKSARRRSH